MHRREVSIVMAMWLASAMGCATSAPAEKTDGEGDEPIPCQDPRPEICTMHYDPVCGVGEDGHRKTYSNACVACSDRAVIGYTEGACATDGSHDAPHG